MAAPNKKVFPLGFEAGRIYALTNGIPAATGLTAYDGVPIGGPTVFTMDSPSREQVVHPGNNGALQYDSLPGIDVVKGTLVGSRIDFDTLALVTGAKVRVTGDTNRILRMTDTENTSVPDLGLLLYTQAKQASGNVRTYSTLLFPSVNLSPSNRGMQRDRNDPTNYEITFSRVSADLTGQAFTTADDGALTGVYLDEESFYRQHYAAFLWDGTGPTGLFSANLQAANTTDMQVFVVTAGTCVERTTNLTKAVTGVTFSTTQPANGATVIVRYPLAVSAVDIG